MARKQKKAENETQTLYNLECGDIMWNVIRYTPNNVKKSNAHCRTWKWQETLKNVKHENCTLQELEYGKKTDK